MSKRKKLLESVLNDVEELDKMIRSWNLIVWANRGEFESLAAKLISHLYQNADKDKIERVLNSELIVTYGLDISPKDSIEFAYEIINWWETKN